MRDEREPAAPPECMNRRYQALDELIRELSAMSHRSTQSGCSTSDQGVRLMCKLWNILKEEPNCNLQSAFQCSNLPNNQPCSNIRPQNVSCYMAGQEGGGCSRPGDGGEGNAPLSKVLCNLKEAATFDRDCNRKLKDLLTVEKQLRCQIAHLENREKEGVALLKKADEMWCSMEDAYKEKIAESLQRQSDLVKQLHEIEASAAKWHRNKKDLETQLEAINKCQLDMTLKINQKTNDIKSIDAEIAGYKSRIEKTKKETETTRKQLSNKKITSDGRLSKICQEITKIEKEIQQESKLKKDKEKEGNGFIKGAREDLQNMCKMLLQKKLEHEDLKAEKQALIQEINMLKDTCDNCRTRCSKKETSILEEIKKVDTEIYDFKLKCVRCNVCVDTADARKFCTDCPRCEQQRQCLMEGESCCADAAEECVCMTVKQKFLDNVFENMYTVLEKQIRTDAGQSIAEEIADCLKKSRNGKLNEHTRKMLQEFILTTVKKNLNLTIVGGAVKTRCELDTPMYDQLMLCLKNIKATPTPKSDKGTDVKKDPCTRWGGQSECHCPKGPKACICTKKAPPPVKDPTPCPPPDKEDAGEAVVCPHKQNVACGPDCGAHTPNRVGRDVAKWRPDPCSGPSPSSCPFGKNMRAAQCVLGPESLIEPLKFGVPVPHAPIRYAPSPVLKDQIECKCGNQPVKPCTCTKDKKLMKAALAKNSLKCVIELPLAESEINENEKGTDPLVKRLYTENYIENDKPESFFVSESHILGSTKPKTTTTEFSNVRNTSSGGSATTYKVSTPGYSETALKLIKKDTDKKNDISVEDDAKIKHSANIRENNLQYKRITEDSHKIRNVKNDIGVEADAKILAKEGANIKENNLHYTRFTDDNHRLHKVNFERKRQITKSNQFSNSTTDFINAKEKNKRPTWNEEIARIVEETVYRDEKKIKHMHVCRTPQRQKSIDGYKLELKKMYDHKNPNNICIKVDGENGLSTKINTPIIKTPSGNFALDISSIQAFSKLSSKREEQPILLKRSLSGTFSVYIGRLSKEDKGPNAVLKRTKSGRLLVVVAEPIFKSISTARRLTIETVNQLYRVRLKDDKGYKDIPAVLEATPSLNYIFVVDKEFQRQHTDYLNTSLEDHSECYIHLEKTHSGILLSFNEDAQNALLVKTKSGNIKILVNGPVYENLSERTIKPYGKRYEELVNELPKYKKRNHLPNSSNFPKAKSRSDSNLLNQIGIKDNILCKPSAKLHRTDSGQYTVILDKEPMKAFILDLQKYLSLSPHGLIPIRKTDSGEITIHLNVGEEGYNYGVLKITPSGNVFVIVDENDIKNLPKHARNKKTSTSCRFINDSCVCEPLKCVCDNMQNYILQSQHQIGIKFDSFKSVTCGLRLKMRSRDKNCGKEICDPKECTAGCCLEQDEKLGKPCTSSSEPFCDTGSMEHCYYLTETKYFNKNLDVYEKSNETIPDLSGSYSRILEDLREQDSLRTLTSHYSTSDEGWNSLNYLPPQLPPFLNNFCFN